MTHVWPSSWERSSLPLPSGRISRELVANDYLIATEYRLSDDRNSLVWALDDRAWRAVRGTGGLLDGFVQLRTRAVKDPSAVVRFARLWGGLGLCRHGRPATHVPSANTTPFCEPVGRRTSRSPRGGTTEGGDAYEVREPLSIWIDYSNRADALLTIAGLVAPGSAAELPSRDLWLAAMPPEFRSDEYSTPPDGWRGFKRGDERATHRVALAAHASAWLDDARIRPRLVWSPRFESFTLRPELDTMYGALALQLSLAIAGDFDWFRCPACRQVWNSSQLHAGQRRPRAGAPTFCPPCRERNVAQDLANKNQNEKRRAARARQRGAQGGKTRTR
jgi:hypothetical protein